MRILIWVLLGCVSAMGASKHVRQGAVGSGSGDNWTDAYTSLPAALTRGDTYYVADTSSSLGSYTFDDTVSGTTLITVKKATEAEHGSATGWSSAFGDGQAVWGKITFSTDYIVFDGVVGHGSDWWYTFTPYGFKIDIGGADNGVQIGATRNNNSVKYCEIDGNGSGTTSFDGLRLNQGGDNWTFSHLWVHHFDRCAFKIGQSLSGNGDLDNWLFEYIFAANNSQNGGIHSEFMSARGTATCTFRYNVVKDFKSTGGMIIGNGVNWEIYGNVFFWSANLGSTANNGAIGTWSSASGYAVSGFKIYNNTFWNLASAANGNAKRIFPISNSSSDHTLTNNLWVDCGGASSVFGAGADDHNYNAFYNHGATESESQIQTSFSEHPLNDPANGDFQPSIATTAGLATAFTTDPLGVLYSNGGGWQRGAFAFGSAAPDTTPPNITNLASNTPGSVSATITWTTDDLCSSEVEYGLTTSYGSKVTSATLVIGHSLQITGLSPSTLYHFRVASTNSAGLGTNTADFTFTTAAADTTPPTVTITAPADSATVSEVISFTADASDNVAVVSVKFYVDDAIQVTDTEAGYGFSWNTRNVANGSRSLKAIAEDTSGNKATNTITVTVNNSDAAPAVWWKFDENTGTTSTDVLAGNVATLIGGTWGGGRSGSAFSFDGVNDYASAPNSASLDISGTNITVMAWVRITSTATYQQFVVKGTNTATPFNAWHIYGQHLSSTTWRPHWQITDSSDVRTSASSTDSVNYGEWVHVAGIYSGSQISLYVNGGQSEGTDVTGNLKQYTQPLYLGARGGPTEYMEGLIDDVRIYNRALSTEEVAAVFSDARAPVISISGGVTFGGRVTISAQ